MKASQPAHETAKYIYAAHIFTHVQQRLQYGGAGSQARPGGPGCATAALPDATLDQRVVQSTEHVLYASIISAGVPDPSGRHW